MLNDTTIRELINEMEIEVEPFDPMLINGASLDIRLGNSLKILTPVGFTDEDRKSVV